MKKLILIALLTLSFSLHAHAETTAKKWDVIPDKSTITFQGKTMDALFNGTVGTFTPEIYFDPEHLDQSRVTVDIDAASIDAKDYERNKAMQGKDFLDLAQFPKARFETTKFTKAGNGGFIAEATLTIHGVTVPIQMPFTLSPLAANATREMVQMTGSVTLDRSKFHLGQGELADSSVIANDIAVDISLTATAPAPPLQGQKTP